MMMTVVGIYTVCWLPIHIITILGDTSPEIWEIHAMRYVWNSAHWLAMSSCMYNPFIYWWMSDKFRSGYVFILHKIKYTCCQRGHHDQLVFMNGRGMTFETSFSHVHDHHLHRQRLMNAGGGVDGCRGGGGGGLQGGDGGCGKSPMWSKNGGKMDDVHELKVMEKAVREKDEEGEGERKVKKKSLMFQCDGPLNGRESVPLRKASDPAESGLGSEDGEESETSPVSL
ncbi:hypothetical protein ACOMHN_036903 [Nucella lapillus]